MASAASDSSAGPYAASEAAVDQYVEYLAKVYSTFVSSMPERIQRLNGFRDECAKQRALSCPEYCNHKPVLQHPGAAAAAAAAAPTDAAPTTVTSWVNEAAQVQDACTYDDQALVFPNNDAVVAQYEVISKEAADLSMILSDVRVFISLNLPEMADWNHPEVQNMTAMIAALEELNESEVTNSTKALIGYLTTRKGLEQKAYELPLHTVTQMMLVQELNAWDTLDILYMGLTENLLNLQQLLGENEEIVQGGKFKKAKKHHLYA